MMSLLDSWPLRTNHIKLDTVYIESPITLLHKIKNPATLDRVNLNSNTDFYIGRPNMLNGELQKHTSVHFIVLIRTELPLLNF